MGRLLNFFRRPVAIDFKHIVCKPGDVVCISLPEGLSSETLARVCAAADEFRKTALVTLLVFADGIQINGVRQ